MVVPLALRVPDKLNVCGPATAVRVTLCPLRIPVTGAEPLLHKLGALVELEGGKDTAYVTWPLREPSLFCRMKPPCIPPMNELSEGGDMVNCQFPASCPPVCEGSEELLLPPQPDRAKMLISTNRDKALAVRQNAGGNARYSSCRFRGFAFVIELELSSLKTNTSNQTE